MINTKQVRIGVLTPSSNTVLEPLTSAIVADLGNVSAHFGRFPVTKIAMSADSQAQFDIENPLRAAELLADAKVDAIVWSGTSASWLGFDNDNALCEAIVDRTGIPAGSAVLGVNELFALAGVQRFALVTPYIEDIQRPIIANYADQGIECVAERHLSETNNFAFGEFSEATIAEMVRSVARAKPDAVTIMCTNLRGARIAPELERELKIPIVDSTAAAVWSALKLAGEDPGRMQHWGSIFATSTKHDV